VTQPTRVEHDLIGDRAVPADAYYGVHTLRALENFRITGTSISIYPDLVAALACVKQAAAIANSELGLLDEPRAVAIRSACEELRAGRLLEHFVVDVIQGGAGTSTNMNANEVIANARDPRPQEGRVPAPAPARPRQPVAEHQRRLPDRSQARPAAGHPAPGS
jgi:aspartate ammonia-lyase